MARHQRGKEIDESIQQNTSIEKKKVLKNEKKKRLHRIEWGGFLFYFYFYGFSAVRELSNKSQA
jgi:hypothetical protein